MSWFNGLIVTALPYIPKKIVGFFASRYIAGETLEEAVVECKKLNAMNTMTTIDLLGEFIREEEKAIATLDTYLKVLHTIEQEGLASNVSIKPTSFGASFNPDLCRKNVKILVEKAAQMNNFVRIDMEDHPYTDLTLDMYEKLRQEFPKNVGTVLQAYLKRTYEDAEHLSANTKANLRLCKGIYNEPASIAYKDGREINKNYLATLDLLLSRGAYIGIATHDDQLIEGALRLIEKYRLGREQYEFQMLFGVRSELRKRLVAEGHRLRVYAPFGKDWYRYSLRRLKENPAIISSMMKGFFKR